MDESPQPRERSLFVNIDPSLPGPSERNSSPNQPPKRTLKMVAIATLGVALLVFAAVLAFTLRGNDAVASAPPAPTAVPSCSTKDGQKVYDLVERYAQQWDDANELASSLSRISMAPQVAELQKIRRDVQALDFPECGEKAQDLLVMSMDSYINGYMAFLRQESDASVTAWFKVARNKQDEFGVALVELSGKSSSPSPSPAPTATVKK